MLVGEIKQLYGRAQPSEILKAYSEIEVDSVDERFSGNSALHLACSMVDVDAVALLLEKGHSANTRNCYGLTPLHALAAIDDRYNIIPEADVRRCADMLFDAKTNVIRKDEDLGDTPITLAGKKGRYEILQSAVAHSAKITNSDKNGNNPLHLACQYVRHELENLGYARNDDDKATANRRIDNFVKSVHALLDGGIDPDDKNDSNRSALEIAIESKADKIAVLLKGGTLGDENSLEAKAAGMTLIQAVIANNLDSIRANVELGADINATHDADEFKDMTPLAIACYKLELPTVELLLELKADPNFKDAKGRTAIAKWFVYLGDFNFTIQEAMDKIPAKILNALIKSGMDKNATINDTSVTALLGACEYSDKGRCFNDMRMGRCLAEALIKAGCDCNKTDLNGVSPLMLICSKSGDGITSIAADLLDAGAELTAVDKQGNTALHYAARNTSANAGKELAELLFDYGFEKADVANNDGKSALEIATENNNEPLVKLILTNS